MSRPNHDFVPDWAKGIVWYQIFPERFWNGDPTNDPRLEDQAGAWPHDMDPPWQIHPWTADWYELQPYERANGKDIWHNLQRRRYGGDLQGILDRLDYLQDLGIGGLYLTPVFQAPSSHKYDGATYHHVDPTFGPDPDGDRQLIAAETPDDPATWMWTAADRLLLKLIDEVHRRGMRIILDGVFNHMGITSWPFRDVRQRQQASPYKDWFTIHAWDDPQIGQRLSYDGWAGVPELPELREDENGIVSGPRDYIFAATRRWLDPDGDGDPTDGIDGWRLDVAFCVGHPFWQAWRRHVKAINPQAYVTGELFGTMVYYGEEAGMWGANDPCCRKPMVWPDLSYAPESYQPDGSQRLPPDPVAFDYELHALYRQLIHLRNSTPALQRGDFATALIDDQREIYAFRRSFGSQTVLVALNRGQEPQRVHLAVGQAGSWLDLFTGGRFDASGGELQVEIGAQWGRILQSQ